MKLKEKKTIDIKVDMGDWSIRDHICWLSRFDLELLLVEQWTLSEQNLKLRF